MPRGHSSPPVWFPHVSSAFRKLVLLLPHAELLKFYPRDSNATQSCNLSCHQLPKGPKPFGAMTKNGLLSTLSLSLSVVSLSLSFFFFLFISLSLSLSLPPYVPQATPGLVGLRLRRIRHLLMKVGGRETITTGTGDEARPKTQKLNVSNAGGSRKRRKKLNQWRWVHVPGPGRHWVSIVILGSSESKLPPVQMSWHGIEQPALLPPVSFLGDGKRVTNQKGKTGTGRPKTWVWKGLSTRHATSPLGYKLVKHTGNTSCTKVAFGGSGGTKATSAYPQVSFPFGTRGKPAKGEMGCHHFNKLGFVLDNCPGPNLGGQ